MHEETVEENSLAVFNKKNISFKVDLNRNESVDNKSFGIFRPRNEKEPSKLSDEKFR